MQNQLFGTIPSSYGKLYGNLNTMETFIFFSNSLSGELPASMGNCTNLKAFSVSQNGIGGNIPSTFKDLVNMEHFYAEYTHLTGPIDFFVSMPRLTTILELEAPCYRGQYLLEWEI
jgi:hypothetical protein